MQCRTSGPAVESIWDDFAPSGRFAALALDCWDGSATEVQSFILQSTYSFPVLMNAGYLQNRPQLGGYDIRYDNYVLVDADGIVRYTSQDGVHHPSTGRFFDAALRAAIQAWLPTPVEPVTWSGVKGLFR
jgi:hypothetical protein